MKKKDLNENIISPKEVLENAELFANEKDLPLEAVIYAMEEALVAVTRKDLGLDANIRVKMNQETGEYKTYRAFNVVKAEDYNDSYKQMIIDYAEEEGYKTKVGDELEIEIPSVSFNRSFVQTARTIMASKIREYEKNKILDSYEDQIKHIMQGKIKKRIRDGYIIEFYNGVEAILPFSETIPNESFRIGQFIRSILLEIRREKSLSIVLSRKSDIFLTALFSREIPEIADGFVQIVGIARDPGFRSKVAVFSQDKRIDLKGVCVGVGANRIRSIINELNGEKIDIITYDENAIQYVVNAMQPADILDILVDENKHKMILSVSYETLPKAIGSSNRNVGLVEKLTGWDLEVLSEEYFKRKQENETQAIIDYFIEHLEVDFEVAEVLADNDFIKLDDLIYSEDSVFLELGFEQKEIDNLKYKAKTKQISNRILDEKKKQELLNNDLFDVQGMSQEVAQKLIENNISNREELAEQSSDELLEILDLSEEEIGALIMSARAFWFE